MNQESSTFATYAAQINETYISDGKNYHLLLCHRIFEACCNRSTAFLESLLRNIQKEKSFFTPVYRNKDQFQHAKDLMRFLDAYLFFRFAALTKDASTHLEIIAEYICMRINQCTSYNELMQAFPTLYNGYATFYDIHIFDCQKYSPLIRQVLDRLHTLYNTKDAAQKLSVSSLANSFHVSDKYLSARFIRETGHKLSDEINQARIENAKLYLQYTDFSIEEIAEKTGFCSQNYFSRRFKDSVGVSPTQFRQRERYHSQL